MAELMTAYQARAITQRWIECEEYTIIDVLKIVKGAARRGETQVGIFADKIENVKQTMLQLKQLGYAVNYSCEWLGVSYLTIDWSYPTEGEKEDGI